MIFNSFIFWAFFATVLLLYWRLPLRGQNRLLLVASYIFYGYWDWRYLGLLAASTIVDYYVGYYLVRIDDARKRKLLITVSIVMNLTFLGFFKFQCGACGAKCEYPLTTTYRVIYFVLAATFVVALVGALVGKNLGGGCGIFSVGAVIALAFDYRIAAKVKLAEAKEQSKTTSVAKTFE